MQLDEFIKKVLEDYKMKYSVSEVHSYVVTKAKEMAKQNVAVVDDETVKDWIVNYDPKALEEEKKAKTQSHATEQMNVAVKNKEIKEKQEPKPEPKKEVKKDDQISIFDLL